MTIHTENIKLSLLLKVVSVLQLIIISLCFFSLVLNIKEIIEGGLVESLAWILFLIVLVSFAISNIQLLRAHAILLNLKISFWANMSQMISLNIYGFKYIMMLGFAITPYISISDGFSIGCSYNLLRPHVQISLSNGDLSQVYVGINIVPSILALFFANQYEKLKKRNIEKLISELGRL